MPEQARGDAIDQRSDLFSLGSVIYAMATGSPPFRAESSYGILRRVCEADARPLREVSSDVPDWLETIRHAAHASNRAEEESFVGDGDCRDAGTMSDSLRQPDMHALPQSLQAIESRRSRRRLCIETLLRQLQESC